MSMLGTCTRCGKHGVIGYASESGRVMWCLTCLEKEKYLECPHPAVVAPKYAKALNARAGMKERIDGVLPRKLEVKGVSYIVAEPKVVRAHPHERLAPIVGVQKKLLDVA